MYYHKSNSLRLQGYNYSQLGWYFITLTTKNRSCLFGQLQNGKIVINDAGIMIETTWKEIPEYYSQIEIDIFQVMPDHFHGILIIKPKYVKSEKKGIDPSLLTLRSEELISLITLMDQFKSLTTNRYINGVKRNGWQRFSKKLWEISFYDHVIRNGPALKSVREYIYNNVRKWKLERMGIV